MPGLVGWNPNNAPIWAFRSMLDATGPAASPETRQQMYKALTDSKSAHPGFVDLTQGVLDSMTDIQGKLHQEAEKYQGVMSPVDWYVKSHIDSRLRDDDAPAFFREAARHDRNVDLALSLAGLIPVGRVAGAAGKFLSRRNPFELGSKNPFNAAGQMKRDGTRLLLNQGNTPTCAVYSCGMALDTMGRPVDMSTLLQQANVSKDGMRMDKVANLLKDNGVDASWKYGVTMGDLAAATANGNPVIVAVKQGGSGHAIVVDGITTRHGVPVVAVRDPWGIQYFETVDAFSKRFLRQAIIIKESKQ